MSGQLDRVAAPLMRAESYRRSPLTAWGQRLPPPSIALSREAGCGGTAVAQAVGSRLGWTVYDHQLIEQIAQQMNVRSSLLDTIDERRRSWLRECVDWLVLGAPLSETAYFRRLLESLLALAAKGECVIVGRGAAFALPAQTTLRVRLIANRPQRIAQIGREQGLSAEEAGRYLETSDRQRAAFIRDRFGKDPADPVHYDLVLNMSRWTNEAAADLIVNGLQQLQRSEVAGREVAAIETA